MRSLPVWFVILFASSALAATDYYSQGSLNVNLLTSWRDGLGNYPPNFTNPNNRFLVQNGHNMSASAQWTVSGTNSHVVVQNGGRITTGAYNHQITGTVQNGGTYEVTHTTYSNLGWGGNGVLEPASNFILNNTDINFNDNVSYGNLVVQSGEADCRGSTAGFEVKGELKVTGGGIFSGGLTEDQTLSIANIRVEGNGYFYGSEGSASVTYNISGNVNVAGGYFLGSEGSGSCIYNIGGNLSLSGGFFYAAFRNSGDLPYNSYYVGGSFTKTGGSYYAVNRVDIGYPTYYLTGSGKNLGLGDVSNSYQARHQIYVQSGASYTLSNLVPFDQYMMMIIYGTLNAGTYQIKPLASNITLHINGTLKTANINGLTGSAGTTIPSVYSPGVNLGTNSTIEYNAAATQSVTGRSDYRTVILSGGTKHLAANASIATQLTANAILDINSGATLTLNGQLNASQIIQGQGTLLIAGSSSQLQLPACNLATLSLNRASGCQMIAPSSVTTLNLSSGTFALSSQILTLYGQITGGSAISGGFAAGLIVTGAAATLNLPSSLSLLGQFTLNRANGCSLQGDLASTTINLDSGSLNVGSHTLSFHGALNIASGILSTNSGSTLSVQSGSVDLNLPALNAGALILNRSGRTCFLGGITSLGNLTLAAGTLALGAQTLTVSGSLIHSGGSLSGGPQAQLTLTPTVATATIPSLNLLRYRQMCPISVNLSGSLQVSEIDLHAGVLNLADYSLTISGGFLGGTIVPNAGSLAGSPSSTLVLTADNAQPWQLPSANIGNLSCDLSGGCLISEPVFLQSGLFLVSGAVAPGGSLSLGAGSLIVRQAGWLSGPPTLGGNIRVHYLQSNLTGFELPGQPGYIAQIMIMGLDTIITAGNDVYLSQRLQVMPGCVFDITAQQLFCEPGTVLEGQGQLFGQVQINIGNMGIYAPPAGLFIEPGPLIAGFSFSHLPVAQQINSVNSIQRSWNLQGDFSGEVQIHFSWLPEADNGIPFGPQIPAYVYRQSDDWWEQLGDPSDVSMQVPRSIGVCAQHFSLWTVGPAAPLSPPFLLDFEAGFKHCRVANGDQLNRWVTGTGTAWRNTHAAYISDDGSSHQYEPSQPGSVHFWFDLRFPIDMSDVRLRFEWRGMGESGSDFLSVSLLDCWEMPHPGQPAGGQQLGQMYASSPAWQLVTLTFDSALAGLDKRVVFTWQNDPGGGDQPPAAIDNVRVVTGLPVPGVPLITGFDRIGDQALLSWEESGHANDYLIEWCDDPSAGFLPLSVQYNSPLPVDLDSPRKFFRIRALD